MDDISRSMLVIPQEANEFNPTAVFTLLLRLKANTQAHQNHPVSQLTD